MCIRDRNIYIDYLPDVIVYCQSAPACPYRKRIRKTTSYLLPSIFEGNWSFCIRIVQQLTPSPLKLCTFVSIWTSLITVYNWTLSFGWWIALFGLLITYSPVSYTHLSIPNANSMVVREINSTGVFWICTMDM